MPIEKIKSPRIEISPNITLATIGNDRRLAKVQAYFSMRKRCFLLRTTDIARAITHFAKPRRRALS
jgi:hypothetical protein